MYILENPWARLAPNQHKPAFTIMKIQALLVHLRFNVLQKYNHVWRRARRFPAVKLNTDAHTTDLPRSILQNTEANVCGLKNDFTIRDLDSVIKSFIFNLAPTDGTRGAILKSNLNGKDTSQAVDPWFAERKRQREVRLDERRFKNIKRELMMFFVLSAELQK